MIKFKKPINLNGAQLLDELANVGIFLDKFVQAPRIDANDDLWLDIKSEEESKAKPIVESHNGTIVASEPSIEQKLNQVGLNLDDLKSALGI